MTFDIVQVVDILTIVVSITISVLVAYLIIELSRRNRVLEKVTERVRDALSEEHTTLRRQEEEQLQKLEGNREKKRLMYRIDEILVQSGIRKVFPFLTTEVFITLLLVISSVVFYLVLRFSGEALFGLIAAVLIVMTTYLVLKVLLIRNRTKLDNDILQFANMLENYSRSTDDIVTIFGNISYYLDEPLRTAVGECYMEIMSTGDIRTAFARLDAKVGHRKLSDMLQNLEVCSRHETNYEDVIKGNKTIIKSYLAEKEVLRQKATAARMQVITLFFIALVCFSMVNSMLEGHLFDLLLMGSGGKLILAVCAGVLLYSIWTCFTMGQEE